MAEERPEIASVSGSLPSSVEIVEHVHMSASELNATNQDESTSKSPGRRVTFRDDIVSCYHDPPKPWQDASLCSTDELITNYLKSCELHGVKPFPSLLQQLKAINNFDERNETLSLRNERVELPMIDTIEEILKRVQFRTIDLEGTHLDEEASVALFDMIEYYESCCRLNVSHNKLGVRAWQSCSRLIKKTPCLLQLDARMCPVTEQAMTFFCRSIRAGSLLSTLHLEGSVSSGRPLMILVAALKVNEHLRELYLADNKLMPSDGIQLGSMLRFNHVLSLLDVRNNSIADMGMSHVCDGIHEQSLGKGLHTLVMWNNQLTYQSMENLCRALKSSKCLETLNLGHNNITNEGIHRLKDGLMQNMSLERIGLQAVKIACEGAIALAEFIAESKNLVRLDLRDNDIKTAGLMALSLALKVSNSCTHIDLDQLPKKESGVRDYAEQQQRLLSDINIYTHRNREALRVKDEQLMVQEEQEFVRRLSDDIVPLAVSAAMESSELVTEQHVTSGPAPSEATQSVDDLGAAKNLRMKLTLPVISRSQSLDSPVYTPANSAASMSQAPSRSPILEASPDPMEESLEVALAEHFPPSPMVSSARFKALEDAEPVQEPSGRAPGSSASLPIASNPPTTSLVSRMTNPALTVPTPSTAPAAKPPPSPRRRFIVNPVAEPARKVAPEPSKGAKVEDVGNEAASPKAANISTENNKDQANHEVNSLEGEKIKDVNHEAASSKAVSHDSNTMSVSNDTILKPDESTSNSYTLQDIVKNDHPIHSLLEPRSEIMAMFVHDVETNRHEIASDKELSPSANLTKVESDIVPLVVGSTLGISDKDPVNAFHNTISVDGTVGTTNLVKSSFDQSMPIGLFSGSKPDNDAPILVKPQDSLELCGLAPVYKKIRQSDTTELSVLNHSNTSVDGTTFVNTGSQNPSADESASLNVSQGCHEESEEVSQRAEPLDGESHCDVHNSTGESVGAVDPQSSLEASHLNCPNNHSVCDSLGESAQSKVTGVDPHDVCGFPAQYIAPNDLAALEEDFPRQFTTAAIEETVIRCVENTTDEQPGPEVSSSSACLPLFKNDKCSPRVNIAQVQDDIASSETFVVEQDKSSNAGHPFSKQPLGKDDLIAQTCSDEHDEALPVSHTNSSKDLASEYGASSQDVHEELLQLGGDLQADVGAVHEVDGAVALTGPSQSEDCGDEKVEENSNCSSVDEYVIGHKSTVTHELDQAE